MERKIKILPGGPYEVAGDIPLTRHRIAVDDENTSTHWEKSEAYPQQGEPYHLCRCGHSKNKPYCDGAHAAIGFEGTEYADKAPYMDGAKRYVGEAVDLLDNLSLCSSMRFCEKGLGVWESALASGDPDNRALAIEEACNCAAGRLVIVDKQGNAVEPAYEMEIGLVEDTAAGQRGPLAIRGGVPLEGADGGRYEVRNRMTLCRCGESRNMPFCDISHMNCRHMDGFDK